MTRICPKMLMWQGFEASSPQKQNSIACNLCNGVTGVLAKNQCFYMYIHRDFVCASRKGKKYPAHPLHRYIVPQTFINQGFQK